MYDPVPGTMAAAMSSGVQPPQSQQSSGVYILSNPIPGTMAAAIPGRAPWRRLRPAEHGWRKVASLVECIYYRL